MILHRKALQLNREVDGKRRRIRVEGELLPLRLVISELWRDDGTVVARWLLWTNLPAEIDARTIALWYYWRWTIESYFKLLKSAQGQQVEEWQQENGERILKRLLVASMACSAGSGDWRAVSPSQAVEARSVVGAVERGASRRWSTARRSPGRLCWLGCGSCFAVVDTLERYLRLAPSVQNWPTPLILGGSGCLDSS